MCPPLGGEGVDYVTVSGRSGENSRVGLPAIEYHLSLDMAEELSMVERTAKGKQARLYFIECEKRAVAQPAPVPALDDPAALRVMKDSRASTPPLPHRLCAVEGGEGSGLPPRRCWREGGCQNDS
jgi:hypothetical protein